MVFPPPNVYGEPMSRLMCLSIAVVLSLVSLATQAAPVQKRPKPVWHGYGFLPGYHQPPNNSLPIYASKGSIQGTPDFTPRYWNGAGWYYFGAPRFVHGHWNGGGFGPCWTYTPIGPMWNCG